MGSISGDRETISRNQFYQICQKRRQFQERMVQKRKLLRREWIATIIENARSTWAMEA